MSLRVQETKGAVRRSVSQPVHSENYKFGDLLTTLTEWTNFSDCIEQPRWVLSELRWGISPLLGLSWTNKNRLLKDDRHLLIFGLRWREANAGAVVVVEGESRGICQIVAALANILGPNSLNVQSLPRLQNKVNYTLKEKLHDIPTQAHGHLVIEILCVVLTTDWELHQWPVHQPKESHQSYMTIMVISECGSLLIHACISISNYTVTLQMSY